MKINWGTGIVIAIVCFMSFILFFVIRVSTNDKYEHELVTEDYYNEELKFQNTIDKQHNAQSLSTKLKWVKTDEGLMIEFPLDLDFKAISGIIKFYRPSNKAFDFSVPLKLNSHNINIKSKKLLEGRWNLIVDWSYLNNDYLFKEKIVY